MCKHVSGFGGQRNQPWGRAGQQPATAQGRGVKARRRTRRPLPVPHGILLRLLCKVTLERAQSSPRRGCRVQFEKASERRAAGAQSGSFHPSQKSTFLLASWSGRFADVVLIFSQPRARAGRDAGLRRRQYRAWRTRSAWGALAARGECAGGGGGCARTGVPGARTLEQRRCVCARAVN